MFNFLVKGLFRDRSRFLLPLLVVMLGATLTVAMTGYIRGWITGMIDQNACLDTGHAKVMTRAYAAKRSQYPNELAILEADALIGQLQRDYPEWSWYKRIYFGGILDVDSETDGSGGGRQGPVSGVALDFNSDDCEVTKLGLKDSVKGDPTLENQAVIGVDLSQKLGLNPGDEFVFLGSTMYGSLTFRVFDVNDVISFGINSFDRGMILVDLKTAEQALDMENAAGEIIGFLPEYRPDEIRKTVADFNARQSEGKFDPVMVGLEEQNRLGEQILYYESVTTIFIVIFVVAMSLVLWNAGLISGISRYREFGIRLALGESKGGIYRYLILESAFIGVVGSIPGTLIGLGITYYLKVVGIDIAFMLQDSTALVPTVIRSEFSPTQFYIGFIPGLFSMVLGTLLAGVGIFKRQTNHLLKELEA